MEVDHEVCHDHVAQIFDIFVARKLLDLRVQSGRLEQVLLLGHHVLEAETVGQIVEAQLEQVLHVPQVVV